MDWLQKVLIDEANTLLVWKQRAYKAEMECEQLRSRIETLVGNHSPVVNTETEETPDGNTEAD